AGRQGWAGGWLRSSWLTSVIKRALPRPPPLLAWPPGLMADEAPRHHSDRKADSQESREVMRSDINRIEMHREGKHHHRILCARREGDDHVGDPQRKQRHNDQRKRCGDGHGNRKRAKGRREIAQQYLGARISQILHRRPRPASARRRRLPTRAVKHGPNLSHEEVQSRPWRRTGGRPEILCAAWRVPKSSTPLGGSQV